MTQAGATPNTAVPNVPLQTLALLKQIADRPQDPNKPQGGATITYTADLIRGTFEFPLERAPHPEGEILRVIDFLQ